MVLLGGCSFRPSFRYRMTVEVDTPEGLKTGSAVREVIFSERANGGEYGHVRGEAVAVDLPGGEVLFALLAGGGGNGDHAGDQMASMFRQMNSDTIQLWPDPPQLRSPIVRHPLPLLVTFREIDDPTSITRVNPGDLAARFGPGVRLSRIVVEISEDPLTKRIEERLGWLNDLDQYRTDPSNPFTNTLPNEIGAFRNE